MSFNLDDLALKETTEYHLRHPATDELLYDSEGNAVISHLYGPASTQYRNATAAMQERALKRGNKKVSPAVLKEESTNLLVACSERIDNLIYKGKPVDSAAAFKELYNDPKFIWIREQHDTALGDVASFLEQSQND